MRKRDIIAGIKRARKLIAKGWVQHEMQNNTVYGHPAYCIVGALHAAFAERNMEYRAARALIMPHLDGVCLIAFNDTVGRTKEEVLAMFDKVIAA